MDNLHYAYLRARKGKIRKDYVIEFEENLESFQGGNAYAKWADSFKLRKEVVKRIYKI